LVKYSCNRHPTHCVRCRYTWTFFIW
jgi:hypothetical protein